MPITEKEFDQRNLLAADYLPKDLFLENGIPETEYTPIVRHVYDKTGFKTNDIIKVEGNDYTINYTPDGVGRMIAATQAYTDYSQTGNPQVNTTQTIFYDKNGNKKKIVDPNSHETKYTYSTRDKVIKETDATGNSTTYKYDLADNKVSMTDPRGNAQNPDNSKKYSGDFTINYIYDDLNRLVKGELPRNNDTTEKPAVLLEYDNRGNLVKSTEADNATATYTYTARNKVKTQTLHGTRKDGTTVAYTTTFEYDLANNEKTITDNSGNTTEKFYDSLNRLYYVAYPEGNTEQYTYDANGNQIKITDGKGKHTEITYTANNKPRLTTDPLGHTQKNEYDTRGNITRFTDEKGKVYTYKYDEINRLVKETDPIGYERLYGYDPASNKKYSKDPNGTELAYGYTPNNLLERIMNGTTEVSLYEYDEGGDIKRITQLGAVTLKNTNASGIYTPDPYSLVQKKTTTAGGKTYTLDYDYDIMNRVTGMSYPTGKTIDYTWNNAGQLEGVPGYINEAPVYDNDGLLESITSVNGITSEYDYDKNNRLKTMSYVKQTEEIKKYEFRYDLNGNIVNKNTSSYAYDELNRLTSASLNGDFTIDVKNKQQNVGNVEQDFAGQEIIVFDSNNVEIKLDYASMSIGVNLGSQYDVTKIEIKPQTAGHRVSTRNLEVFTAQTNYKDGYAKTDDWVINTRDDNTMEILFRNPVKATYIKVHCHYDDRNGEEQPVDNATLVNLKQEILKVYYSIDWRYETYGYDEKGNRLTSSVTLEDTKTKNYTYYEHSDRLKTDGTYGYTWDSNGNLTDKGTTYQDNANILIFDIDEGEYWHYEYDILNRLVKVSKSEAGTNGTQLVAEYTYDAENLRIKKTSAKNGITYYIYGQNGEVLAEETEKEIISYVYVNGRHFAMIAKDKTTNTEKTYFYGLDHLGSTVLMTDESGKVVWQNEATPFGNWSGEVGIEHYTGKFTGKDFDEEIGLYYYNARWMDPETGRFISEDPAKDGSNWYVYCGNNPIIFMDPTGLFGAPLLEEGARQTGTVIFSIVEKGAPRLAALLARGGLFGLALGLTLSLQSDTVEKPLILGDGSELYKYNLPFPWTTEWKFNKEKGNATEYFIVSPEGQKYNVKNLESDEKGNVIIPSLPPNYRYEDGNIIAPNGTIMPSVNAAYKHSQGRSDWADDSEEEIDNRKQAFNRAKRDAGIPTSQQPDETREVPLRDPSTKKPLIGSDGKPIMSREYIYTNKAGIQIVIQDHSGGHYWGQNGVGDQGSHFNVRPIDDPNGKIKGTQEHYPFTSNK